MSSDEQKKDDVIVAKKFYLEQEIYQQIINGFESAKERQLVDKKNMPVILRIEQIIRLKLSSPYIFGGFFDANWFKSIFENEYQGEKKKKMKSIRDAFYYSWYDLEWWFSQLEDDEEQFEAKKDKKNWFTKIRKAYRTISRLSRWYKAIKVFKQSCQNSPAVKALFGQSYNFMNEGDYKRFEANLNWVVQTSDSLFINSIMVFTQPTMKRVSYLYCKTLQQLYDRFCWWLIKTLLIGDKWYEVVFTIVGVVFSIFTAGAAGAAMVAGRWLQLATKLKRIFGVFYNLGSKLIKNGSRLMRGVGKTAMFAGKYGSKFMGSVARGGSKLASWGSKTLKSSRNGGVYRSSTKWMRAHKKGIKRINMVASPAVAIALFYLDDEHYNRVRRQIHKRTAIMYKGVEEHLVNLRNSQEMIGDISLFLKDLGNKSLQRYDSKNSSHEHNESQFRTNRQYGTKLKVHQDQVARHPLVKGLRKWANIFNFYTEKVVVALSYVGKKLDKLLVLKKGGDNSRLIYSQGSGKFGIALFSNKTKLVFENINFNELNNYIRAGNDKDKNKKFYGQVIFDISDEKLRMSVNGKDIIKGFSTVQKKPLRRPKNAIYIKNFLWTTFNNNLGDSAGLRDGFKITFQNFNGTLHKGSSTMWDDSSKTLTFNDINHPLWLGMDDIKENYKNVTSKRKEEIYQQDIFSKKCEEFARLIIEACTPADEDRIRAEIALRKEIAKEWDLLRGYTFYTGYQNTSFQQFYQYSALMVVKAGAAWEQQELSKITMKHIERWDYNIDVVSDEDGGMAGVYSNPHDGEGAYGVVKQKRTVTGYHLKGGHAIGDMPEDLQMRLATASKEELENIKKQLEQLRKERIVGDSVLKGTVIKNVPKGKGILLQQGKSVREIIERNTPNYKK